jgi:hypothetical protein
MENVIRETRKQASKHQKDCAICAVISGIFLSTVAPAFLIVKHRINLYSIMMENVFPVTRKIGSLQQKKNVIPVALCDMLLLTMEMDT